MELGFAVFVLTLPFLWTITQSIRFEIESGQTRCIGEDIKKNAMTVGYYSIVNPNEGHPLPEYQKLYVRMFTAKGIIHHTADAVESGQFMLQAVDDGNHHACFTVMDHNQPPFNTTVEFDWRSGVAAKSWSKLLKRGSVDSMQLELKKMEDMVASIHEEMFYLQQREEEMEELNKITNFRMGLLSLVSLFLCLSVAGLQLWHLKTFFEKKKII